MKLEPLKGTIAGVMARPEWQRQQQFEELCRRWPTLVGAAVAQRTRPTGVRQGVLQVAVAHGTWAQTLTYERRRILKKVQDALPSPLVQGLQEIQFSTARWHGREGATPSRSTLPLPNQNPLKGHSPAPAPALAPPGPRSRSTQPNDSQTPRPSAGEAFARWAARRQARSQQFPRCRRCQCPAPPAELDRWGVCGACMRQEWAAAGSALGTPTGPPTGPIGEVGDRAREADPFGL
jgi:predicted nucleic acid-binding Zn ribbon protein